MVKERKGELTDNEKENFKFVKNVLTLERTAIVSQEIEKAGLKGKIDETDKIIFANILNSISSFSPSVLMHGKNQVYWEFDSYIHIVCRHIAKYQLGSHKSKTSIPYKETDLKTLIEKVLRVIESEIKQYFEQQSPSDFMRHGRMAVFFNGDHYHLRISPKGKLLQFHIA